MIKSIFIENFKSCHNLLIKNIKDTLVLVGKNGAGKTNILRAIEWAALSVTKQSFVDNFYSPPDSLTLIVELGKSEFTYRLECTTNIFAEAENNEDSDDHHMVAEEFLTVKEGDSEKVIFKRSAGDIYLGAEKTRLKIGRGATACAAILTTQPIDQTTRMVLEFSDYMRGVSYNHLDTLAFEAGNRVVFENDYLKWLKVNHSNQDESKETEMRVLDLSRRRIEKFNELKEVLSHLGIISNIEISTLDSKESKIHFFHWYSPLCQEEPLSWADLSYGTRRLIKLFVTLFYKEDKVFMIEQPEDGIHSGLLHQIMPMLQAYNSNKQIIIATHSAQILDKCSPEDIRFVYFDENTTHARELSEDEIESAKTYIQENGSFSDFLSMIEE